VAPLELTSTLSKRNSWLVTGAAGFIGSNLCEFLVRHGQRVVALDNFLTGHEKNILEITQIAKECNADFTFIHGDIRNFATCKEAMHGTDYVLHQAALGSVPRSIADPLASHAVNVDGFLNMLNAARESKIKRFVYASSSSVYGDHPDLPKIESKTGQVLSPYAATKAINELYAAVFHRNYGLETVGLRYFNVFGPRQDPNGAYAAVIPKWTSAIVAGETIKVNGDGSTSRDFCFVSNVVQANLKAAISSKLNGLNEVFNVAFGERTTLLELANAIATRVGVIPKMEFGEFRSGDVHHSLANCDHARSLIGYEPNISLAQGLDIAVPWYQAQHQLSRVATTRD
jgi:UDP-N-acetylglucosamine/UDP-N-acetylgalactosamine 4-epimerase